MTVVHVAAINEAPRLNADYFEEIVTALNHQQQYHFAPVYGVHTKFYVHQSLVTVPKGMWVMRFIGDLDIDQALGYHQDDTGVPTSLIGVNVCLDNNLQVSVTASHEACEMAADPSCVTCAQVGEKTFVAWEACDPVEADDDGYEAPNGMPLSDFITPAWYGVPGQKIDHVGHLEQPGDVRPGGYVAVWTPTKGWQQVMAAGANGHSRAETAKRIRWRGRTRKGGLAAMFSARPEPAPEAVIVDAHNVFDIVTALTGKKAANLDRVVKLRG